MSVIVGKFVKTAIAAAFCAASVSAFAQPVELTIGSDEDWSHDWTNMRFPARINGFQRNRLIQFEDRQTNMAANYEDRKTGSVLTIYIYRPIVPDAQIWFDRALQAIGARQIAYGKVDLSKVSIASFAPNGAEAKSGQLAVLEPESGYRSTSVAMFRADQWLIKVRISSQKLSKSGLKDLTSQIASELPALDGVSSDPAYLVEECKTPMELDTAVAFTSSKGDAAIALEASASLMAASTKSGRDEGTDEAPVGTESEPVRYCRAGMRRDQFNQYRPNEATDRYILAIGDAGNAISVFPGQLFGAEPGGESARMITRVHSGTGLETVVHRPFIGVPDIQAAADSVFRSPALAKVSRPLGNEGGKITLLVAPDDEQETVDDKSN